MQPFVLPSTSNDPLTNDSHQSTFDKLVSDKPHQQPLVGLRAKQAVIGRNKSTDDKNIDPTSYKPR